MIICEARESGTLSGQYFLECGGLLVLSLPKGRRDFGADLAVVPQGVPAVRRFEMQELAPGVYTGALCLSQPDLLS